jgi:hypothetical protein
MYGENCIQIYRQAIALQNTVLHSTIFLDVTPCSGTKVSDISEEYTAHIFRADM